MIKKEAAIAVLRECINNKDAACSTQSKKDAFLLAIDALKKLDPAEQKIIYLRYFRDYSQQQIADALGLSQVKVSRTEKKIYEKLRQMLTV